MRRLFLCLVVLLLAGIISACQPEETEPETLSLRIVSPPNPNSLPLIVALDMAEEEMEISFLPVPGVPEIVAALSADDADVALFFSASGATFYQDGTLPDLRMWSINVWRALYLVADPAIAGYDDLAGGTILASFPGGAPDLVMRASMTGAGFDPDADFTLQYMPAAQARQLLIAGDGDAALLPEPTVTQTIRRAQADNLPLAPVIDLQAGFGAAAWDEGLAPLGAVFTLADASEDDETAAAVARFTTLYAAACDRIMREPEVVAPIISEGFDRYFGADLPPEVIVEAVESGRLAFDTRPVADLRPDLDAFLASVTGAEIDDAFFFEGYVIEPSTSE